MEWLDGKILVGLTSHRASITIAFLIPRWDDVAESLLRDNSAPIVGFLLSHSQRLLIACHETVAIAILYASCPRFVSSFPSATFNLLLAPGLASTYHNVPN